ncbi:hypothetical protein BDW60DRAFT_169966 [Aspergillus nidulans var. acristatus]
MTCSNLPSVTACVLDTSMGSSASAPHFPPPISPPDSGVLEQTGRKPVSRPTPRAMAAVKGSDRFSECLELR